MSLRSRFVAALIGIVAVAGIVDVGPAHGGAADDATQFMRRFSTDVINVLTASERTDGARKDSLAVLVVAHVDIEYIGRFAVGRQWQSANETERTEFRHIYEGYVVRSLVQRLLTYKDERFDILSASALSGGDLLVSSRIVRSAAATLAVDWRVRPSADGFRIVDLMVEGMSLAITQRDEFASILRGGSGLAGLVAALKERTPTL